VTEGTTLAVVVDTMVLSALINAARQPEIAAEYAKSIEARPVVVSFATVTELRYGAMKAGRGDLRRRALERDLARFVVVQPDDRLMAVCAELRSTCEAAAHPLGQKIHEADGWIASTAMRLRVELISDDRVFDEVASLSWMPQPFPLPLSMSSSRRSGAPSLLSRAGVAVRWTRALEGRCRSKDRLHLQGWCSWRLEWLSPLGGRPCRPQKACRRPVQIPKLRRSTAVLLPHRAPTPSASCCS